MRLAHEQIKRLSCDWGMSCLEHHRLLNKLDLAMPEILGSKLEESKLFPRIESHFFLQNISEIFPALREE